MDNEAVSCSPESQLPGSQQRVLGLGVPLCYKQILASTWLQTESGDAHGAVGEGPSPGTLAGDGRLMKM